MKSKTRLLLSCWWILWAVFAIAQEESAIQKNLRRQVEKELKNIAIDDINWEMCRHSFLPIVRLGPQVVSVLLAIFSDETYKMGSPVALAYPIRLLAGQALAECKDLLVDNQELLYAELRRLTNHPKADVQDIAVATLYRLGDVSPFNGRMQRLRTQIYFWEQQKKLNLGENLVHFMLAQDHHQLAIYYIRLRQDDAALNHLRLAVEYHPAYSVAHYNLACVYACLGKDEEALDALEQAVATGFSDLPWLVQDAYLQNIREQPRFQKVVMGLRK